jgi:hypothetical protein
MVVAVPPRTGTLPTGLVTATATVLLILAALTTLWAIRAATTTARTWRPAGD